MQKGVVSQSSFDYLLLEIVMNRIKKSDSNEDCKDKLFRIGYDVGFRLTEKFPSLKTLKTAKESVQYLLEQNWSENLFKSSNTTISKYEEITEKTTVSIKESTFISNISSFSNETLNSNTVKEIYLSYLRGIITGSLATRYHKTDVVINKLDNDNNFDIVVTIINETKTH